MRRREFLKLVGMTAMGTVLPNMLQAADWVDQWWATENQNGEDLPVAVKPEGLKVTGGPYCDGLLRLKSAIHGEAYEFRFRDSAGNYDTAALQQLNWFLRCRDGAWQAMDIRVIEILNYLSALLHVPLIQINSGYRSPAYNAKLAATNENVARNSLHQYGQALDISIPGIPVRDICSYALYARDAIGYGGVGYYPKAGFVHLDSGRTKQWIR